ncbi:hypothetical protein C8R46DRAFT_1208327 [Mycena filopes]|nr:hypothetical protein C8R46DRAFT_1208327 [Mycena filopes]
MQNLLRTLTDSKAHAAYPECDLTLLLTTVKDGRRQPYDAKLTDPFYDSLEGLLLDLRTTSIDNHDAEAFLKPVSKAEVPDYYDVITTPMDLQTMLKKVKQKQYKSKREFKDDLDLIWSNCFTYNATETHPLRKCAKRLKLKADRLLRNITDRKERADPLIPAALGGGGALGSTFARSKSPFPPKHNGVNGTRPPTITIKPGLARKSGSRNDSSSTGTAVKRAQHTQQPFAEMPALVRTAEGMRAFADAERGAAADPTLLRSYLPPDVELPVSVKLEEAESAAPDAMQGVLGDKRPWSVVFLTSYVLIQAPLAGMVWMSDRGSVNGKTAILLRVTPTFGGLPVHSDTLLANGLPSIAHPRSSPSTSAVVSITPPRKRRKKKKNSTDKGEKTLLGLMSTNIRTMRRLRHTHARFAALGLGSSGGGGGDELEPAPLPPMGLPPQPSTEGLLTMPELAAARGGGRVDEDEGGKAKHAPASVSVSVLVRARRSRRLREEEELEIDMGGTNADRCMRWMGGKVLEHAGFQGTSTIALDVLASVTSEYLLNVGRTIRYLCDKYSQTMTSEEIILHTLFESGISRVQDLERYISDDVERYGARLGDLEKKLVGAYREVTAVDVLSDEGLFEDEEEEGGALTMGDFADALGEDYLGLRELGIAAEFGMQSLSIPKKLLRGKKRAVGVATNVAPAPPPLPFPLPPPFLPLTAAKVESQIGLLRPYYIGRFTMLAAQAASLAALHPPPPLPGPQMLPALPGSAGHTPVLLPTPMTMAPPPPPPVVQVQPYHELPDDAPTPVQAKMGPLGQILLSKAGTKKKVSAVSSAAGGAAVKVKTDVGGVGSGAGDAPKKKKKGATGVGTGNGRKKIGKNDGALMPPPPVPAPIVAAGV